MIWKNLRHAAKLLANAARVVARHDVLLEPGAVVKYVDTLRFGAHTTVQAGAYVYGSRAGRLVEFGANAVVAAGACVLGEGGVTIGSYTHLGPGTVVTSAIYGINLFMAGLAYFLLVRSLRACHAPDSRLNQLTASAVKENASTLLYLIGIGASLLGWVPVAYAIYVLVALMWVIPDRRYEALLQTEMTRSPK